MDTIFVALIGILASSLITVVLKFISGWFPNKNTKIKIGQEEIELSGSVTETTQRILEKVQELQAAPQVFLSYTNQDREFAYRLADDLRKRGVKVWLADEQIKVGDKWVDAIRDGILSSQWIIILISKNLPKSDYVSNELELALAEERNRERPFILPILIEDTEIPIQLQDRQFADFRENYDLGLEKIFARVKPSTIKGSLNLDF
jgi:hypothetical protein